MKRNQTYRGRLTKYRQREKNITIAVFICLVIGAGLVDMIVSGLKSNHEPIIDQPVQAQEFRALPEADELVVIPIAQEWVEPIENAAAEFNVDPLLIYGIANAESGLGKYFYNPYDRDNCFNIWGLKGGKTPERIAKEGSYIRCFNDYVAGARTVAKTLRLYYLDEGRDTPEKICEKWVGAKHAPERCGEWVENVREFAKK